MWKKDSKKVYSSLNLIITMMLLLMGGNLAKAQSNEVAQLLLNVEKLAQFKQILKDMEEGYRVLSSGYNTVKDISEGSFKLHEVFLDGLMQVSPAVRKYRKVPEIISYQIELVQTYQKAQRQFFRTGYFSREEQSYIGSVYDNLFKLSLRNLDELINIITAGQLRMNDAERIQAIDQIHHDMEDKLVFVRSFNGKTALLGVNRAKQANDLSSLKIMYGIEQ